MKILFLSSHVGLGHVTRDYAISKVLVKEKPGIKIDWCTAQPALGYLEARGETRLLGCCNELESFSRAIEEIFNETGYRLDRLRSYLEILRANYQKIRRCIEPDDYDLIYADEFWELMLSGEKRFFDKTVFATDFVYKPYELNPLQFFISLALNRYFKKKLLVFKHLMYLNSIDETPSGRWYPLIGESVREWIRKNMFVAGLTTSYIPGELSSRSEARERLGLGEEPILTATVGGTGARSIFLLSKIIEAFKIYKEGEEGKNAKLIVVSGPRTPPPKGEKDVISLGLVPDMRAIYAASDLFITRPGRTTTADIECLPWGQPAVFIPIKNHFEHKMIAQSTVRRNPSRFAVLEENESPLELARHIRFLLGRRIERTIESRECSGVVRASEYILNAAQRGYR